jgi:hypothetical protein
MDKNKCPKIEIGNSNMGKTYFVTIIENYGVANKKIFVNL